MAIETNEDVKWYVMTRKDSGAHSVRNENYVAVYEREYERIREFDLLEDAQKAYEARIAADPVDTKKKDKQKIKAGKLRGDIKKGSIEDEDVRSKIRAELLEELKAEGAIKPPSSSEATVGPKTKARATKAKE